MNSLLLRAALLIVPLACAVPLACGGDSAPTPSSEGPPTTPEPELCETNDDCTEASKSICDGFAGCVECVLDDHCAEGANCEEHACVTPQACSSSADCTMTDALFCNPVLGECAECVWGPECGQGHICNQGTCESVTECVNSLDCAAGTVCDRELSYCVDCIADGDCEETHACVANECIPRCDSDKDCTSEGELCNRSAGYCVECVENVDCPELYHCAQGSCDVDVCIAGESTCNSNLNGREICEPEGAATYFDQCGYGTTCVQLANFTACSPWTCTPGAANCSQDGTALVICDADGLGSTVTADCSSTGGVCENSACVDVVCEAGLRFCDDRTVMQCSETGTSFTSVGVCGTNQHCSEEAQGCALNVCTPNTGSCDGNVLRTCDSEGSGYLAEETDCEADGKVCFNAACQTKVCETDELSCVTDDVYSCQDNGARLQMHDNCVNTTEYCEDGECKTRTCTPGQPACDGELTGTCDALGSEVDTSAGTDCSTLTDQACWNGVCEDKICDPGGKQICSGQDRLNCINNGSATQLSTTCSASSYCNDSQSMTTCTPRICTPSSPVCDGNRATTCNANGSGYAPGGITCDADELCVTGTCLPVICTANAYFCQNGNVQRCGSDGTTSQLQDTCSAGEFCEEGATFCRTDLCTGGQPTCDGPLVTTCAQNGSGPLAGGTACPDGQTCAGGACLTVFCTPGSEYCEGNFRRTCNATGTGYSASSTCSTTYYCSQETPTTTLCRYDICNPASATCDGETLATCSADGGGYVSQGTDCSSTDQLCNGSGCVDILTPVIGGITTGVSTCNGYRLGNRYAFASARTLTEISQYLNITGTIQLTWVIYESDSANLDATYTLVFEKLTTSTGLIYHSSGPIDFAVEPGKHYVMGVRPAGVCTAYYGGTATYLPSGGYVSEREAESDSGALDATWYFTGAGTTATYAQQLVFE